MKKNYTENLAIPKGVTVTCIDGNLVIKGAKGEVGRSVLYPGVRVHVEGDKLVFETASLLKREYNVARTFLAHTKNLFKGVMDGHIYLLKICSSHFPMNVAVSGNELSVKNFIGEKTPRKLIFPKSVKIEVKGLVIEVSGADKEQVAQTAANIEQLTRRGGFDKRRFQDGIWMTDKDGKGV